MHQRAGHLTVTPIARDLTCSSAARPPASSRVAGFGAAAARWPCVARAAPGHDVDFARARVRPVDPVCRQRRRPDLLRRPAAAHPRGRPGRRLALRWPAPSSRRCSRIRSRTPDTLGVSSGAALGAMLAIAFHFDFAIAGLSSVVAVQPRRIDRRARHRLHAGDRAGGAGCPRRCCCWPA